MGLFFMWLIYLIVSGASYFLTINTPPRTQCAGVEYGVPCLPKAPERPVRSATFKILLGPAADRTIDFVITDAYISLHVVQTLPPEIALSGISVTKGVSHHLASLKSLPPLIFSGSIEMHVGPIQENDQITTRIVLSEHAIKSVETLYDGSARGPPKENEVKPVRDVYIVGFLMSYYGPNQVGQSIHNAQIIDLGASSGKWNQYKKNVEEWRSDLAKATELPRSIFATATNDIDAQYAAYEVRAYQMQNPAYHTRDPSNERREEYRRPLKVFR